MPCNKKECNGRIITSIGGSALIEGIMMRGPKRTTVAVRTKDGIYKEDIQVSTLAQKYKVFKVPIIRGLAGLIDSMRLSYKALMISADKSLEDIEEEPGKFEKWVTKVFGDKFMAFLMTVASILGVGIAILLFYIAPTWLCNMSLKLFKNMVGVQLYRSVFEGIIRIVLFLAYIITVSQMSDMKRVFMYHGAEHKTIFCYENNEELTVENVRKYKRFHPRCGTSFLVIMLLVGIIIGLFIPFANPLLRTAVKLLLLPITVGFGYELIKLCSRRENFVTKIIAAPGMWAQRITTREPDDSMIEVAIAAMKEVIPENGEDRIA